jgi:microcystin-dependent protein
MPIHAHTVQADGLEGNSASPTGNVWAKSGNGAPYYSSSPGTVMSVDAIGATGGGQPHNNMQPYLAINYIIALVGIFPSPN